MPSAISAGKPTGAATEPGDTELSVEQRLGAVAGGSEITGAKIGQVVAQRDAIIRTFQVINQRALTAAEAANIAADLELKLLAQGVSKLAERLAAQVTATPTGGSPYKGLVAYGLGDADRFFGRRAATDALRELLRRGRLAVLHAESGAGKSSLLQAGIAARLLGAGHLAVCLRPYRADPSVTIKEAFLDLDRAPRLARLPLREFLRSVTDILGPDKTLYLLLDQFEEFYAYLDKAVRDAFSAELGASLNDASLNVRWVIALRGEALSRLAEMEAAGVEPFENEYRLARLSRDEAREVITGPGFAFAPDLVAAMLDGLTKNGEVAPPQLQLVCLALTEGLAPSAAIGREKYDRLGGTEGILRDYLVRQVAQFPAAEREPVRRLLRTLVTADGRRAVLAYGELTREWEAKGGERSVLDTILARLVERRLLVVQERPADGERTYELAHDTLLREVQLDPAEQARKFAQELLNQEMRNWTANRSLLIPPDKLEYIYSQRSGLVLDATSEELLLRSGLQADFQTAHWLSCLGDPGLSLSVLTECAGSAEPEMRIRAADALGRLATPPAVDLLLSLALEDPDRGVRNAIRGQLPRVPADRGQIARWLVEQSKNGNGIRQRRATELLASMPLDAIPTGMRFRIRATRLRLAVQGAYERHLATPERRLAVGGALAILLIIAAAYLFSSANYFMAQSSSSGAPSESVVVKRGRLGFLLPGLSQEVIVTDYRRPDFSSVGATRVGALGGYWWQLPDRGYQDLLGLLSPEPAARSRWFLGSSFRTALLTEIEHDLGTDIKPFGMDVLDQMMTFDPAIVSDQSFGTLRSLFLDQNPDVRMQATRLTYRFCEYKPALAADCLRFLLNQVKVDPSREVQQEIMTGMGALLAEQEAPLAPDLAAGLVDLLMHRNYDVYWDARGLVAQAAEKHPQSFLSPEVAAAGYRPLLQSLRAPAPAERERAADALYVLARSAPGMISPELPDLLLGLLADPAAPVRASAAHTLGLLATVMPDRAAGMAAPLLELLTDSNERVQQYAAGAVAMTVEADPKLTPATIEKLYGLLTYQNDRVVEESASALAQIAGADQSPSSAARSQAILLGLLYHEQPDVRDGALRGMTWLAKSRPEALMEDAAAAFASEALTRSNVAESLALDVLRQVRQGAGAEVLLKRVEGIAGFYFYDWARFLGPDLLQKIGTLHPKLAPAAIDALLAHLRNLSDLVQRYGISSETPQTIERIEIALIGLMALDGDQVTLHTERLNLLLHDPSYSSSHNSLLVILAGLTLRSPESIPPPVLAEPRDPIERGAAARALFLIGLSDTGKEKVIAARLAELAGQDQPIGRIWANTTLQLLRIGDLARAAQDTPEGRGETFDRLCKLQKATFFGPESSWAAAYAAVWLRPEADSRQLCL